jgi:ribosome biogenesis SPOUT family RNA methylase Rps3
MLFVIEHLEPKLSEWLHIEYSNAARIVGKRNLLITNVKNKSENEKLSKVATVERRRVFEIFRPREIVVLDPMSRKTLSPSDLVGKRAIIIGGILGDYPPLGRTKEMLTKTIPKALTRNIGKHQFSIDGATYMAKQVSLGKSLKDVPFQLGFELRVTKIYTVLLPYAFPLVRGNPLLSSKLIRYLKSH